MKRRTIIWYDPKLKRLAQELRNRATKAEIILWLQLKNGQLLNYTFHRQKPLNHYIVDFYCPELKLAIEVDGEYHEQVEVFDKDLNRDKTLNTLGISVLRFTNKEVFNEMDTVLRTIENYVSEFERAEVDKE